MYTSQTITQAVYNLTDAEKQILFQLVTDHADLLNKIIPGLPLVGHVIGQEKSTHPFAKQYDSWLNAKT